MIIFFFYFFFFFQAEDGIRDLTVTGVQKCALPISGSALLQAGLLVCVLGLLFGLMMYVQLKNLPVHRSMREISELIFETCKTRSEERRVGKECRSRWSA